MILPGSTVVIATHNQGKLREFQALLRPTGWRIEGLPAGAATAPAESGATYAANARIKALDATRFTPDPVLSDDSGLEVFSLGGRPGVHSARYAGPGAPDSVRNARLLEELRLAGGARDARFVCALTLARSGTVLLEVEGECRGTIAHAPRGGAGFGYDPVFLVPDLGRTFSELSEAEKGTLSHRARAVQVLLARLGE